jgi:hypothetical protein
MNAYRRPRIRPQRERRGRRRATRRSKDRPFPHSNRRSNNPLVVGSSPTGPTRNGVRPAGRRDSRLFVRSRGCFVRNPARIRRSQQGPGASAHVRAEAVAESPHDATTDDRRQTDRHRPNRGSFAATRCSSTSPTDPHDARVRQSSRPNARTAAPRRPFQAAAPGSQPRRATAPGSRVRQPPRPQRDTSHPTTPTRSPPRRARSALRPTRARSPAPSSARPRKPDP